MSQCKQEDAAALEHLTDSTVHLPAHPSIPQSSPHDITRWPCLADLWVCDFFVGNWPHFSWPRGKERLAAVFCTQKSENGRTGSSLAASNMRDSRWALDKRQARPLHHNAWE